MEMVSGRDTGAAHGADVLPAANLISLGNAHCVKVSIYGSYAVLVLYPYAVSIGIGASDKYYLSAVSRPDG